MHGEAQVKHTSSFSHGQTCTSRCTCRHMHTNSEACTPENRHVHTIHVHTIHAHTVNLGTHALPDEYTYTFRNSLTHRFRGLLAAEAAHRCVQSSCGGAAHGEEPSLTCPSQVSYPDATIHLHPHALGSPSVQGRAFVSP